MIYVTKTYLPPQEEYQGYLEQIWSSGQVTNNGALVKKLEDELKEYLGVKYLIYLNNGTIALQIAIKAMGLTGEVITTPFSYVATTSSLVWEGCKPVFADIDPHTLCIDPKEIEKKITPQTTGIMATHVYGNSCAVEELETIAGKHGLKVIYDGAHAFGAEVNGRSVLSYGDVSTLSFHATKLFHTIEGGAIVTENEAVAHTCEYMRRFGHKTPDKDFYGVGVNGKSSEFHAAMGLCVLPHVTEFIARRKEISELYDQLLQGSGVKRPGTHPGLKYNYAYYPVLFPNEESLLKAVEHLNAENIFPRRYFRPSLNQLHYVQSSPCPVSEHAADVALCLPLYPYLDHQDVRRIAKLIREALGK
jgi:dTDP-4-amino-4,6-dideoxygalactose transaminase